MKLLSYVLMVTALTAITPTSVAADAPTYTLRYKFQQGDVIRYQVDHRASVRSTMDKTTQEAQTRSESVKAWKVVDVLPGGEIEFHNVVEQVKMTNRLPDRAEMVYDSEKDKTPPPGFEDAAKAVGVTLSAVRMTPWGEVVNREIKHEQPAADPSAPITVRLPEDAVAVGDSWDEPQDIKVKTEDGASKVIKTRRHFTLKSVKNGVAVIDVAQQVLSPVTAPIEAQLAQRMMKGVIRFDIQSGRILTQRMDVDRRILGFAGPTSSMHYVMRMEERLTETQAPKTAFKERSILVGPKPAPK